ncbi:MAG TPA: S8 family serine peptidase [Candidatus Polarisedimenticolia bacterium]|nr:S8 family serine peptidase [Candidatus Polarisedimenticolia bacterium]
MKRITIIVAMIVLMLGAAKPAAAQNRYIVRTTGGLSSVLNLCNLLGCQVQGGLDGSVGQNFLVTSSNNLLANIVNGGLTLVESLLGIVSVEADRLLPIPQPSLSGIPSGLYDTAPVNYYGAAVWHGYAAQPATQIIRLQDAQNGFRIAGTGIVAVIDTGVDVNHPVLYSVLLPGYDFTRNQPGASEWLDVSGMQNGYVDTNTQNQQPGYVQQSTAAVLDQSTAAVLDGGPYSAFGHGTMTTGLVHLVAPQAKILPLKAFSSNGVGYLSNIVAALYYAVQHHANVVNMSFDLDSSSPSLTQAAGYANKAGVVLVAAAGNENTSVAVYPAALNNYVVGIASTTNWDSRSSFSNYGVTDVWIAAPGENIISTFPGGTYASASGTSFSSPMVAGAVALMLNAKPSLNQNQATSSLSHAIKLTPDLNRGRLDVYQAVSAWVNSSGSTSGGSGSCLLLCW